MYSLRQKFGRHLRKIRRQKNLTQEQLAESVGVSVEFLSNIERGINAPSFETLEKISQELKVTVAQLFDFQEAE